MGTYLLRQLTCFLYNNKYRAEPIIKLYWRSKRKKKIEEARGLKLKLSNYHGEEGNKGKHHNWKGTLRL